MSNLLSVDLASKFSAYCVLDSTSQVLAQGDSRGLSAFELAYTLRVQADNYDVDLIILEDVPYGIRGQFQTKPVLRLQGVLVHALKSHLDNILFVNPSTWQRTYPGVSRGEKKSREDAARKAAEEFGYTPPPLVDDWVMACQLEGKKALKRDTNPLAKNETDYIDAWLMGHWANLYRAGIRDLSGVQPVMI